MIKRYMLTIKHYILLSRTCQPVFKISYSKKATSKAQPESQKIRTKQNRPYYAKILARLHPTKQHLFVLFLFFG